MMSRYKFIEIGTHETQCLICGKYVKASVLLVYDEQEDMKLCRADVFCKECETTIFNRKITDETDLNIKIDRFSEQKPFFRKETLKTNPNPFKPTVKCPYCGSTSTKKISTLSRMGSFATFGFAGKKVGKQWHCNNCKSDF